MRRRQASNRSGESLSSYDNSEESSPASKPKTFGEIMKRYESRRYVIGRLVKQALKRKRLRLDMIEA